MPHCSDNKGDRALGTYWEQQFCVLAAQHGFMFSPLQIDKAGSATAYWQEGRKWQHLTLPDVTIWTCPGQHHEIKHKSPTRRGDFGLEGYRFHALLHFAKTTHQAVLYTIHNHVLSGGRDARENRLQDWFAAEVLALEGHYSSDPHGISYVNGQRVAGITIYYWPVSLWMPLAEYWKEAHATT